MRNPAPEVKTKRSQKNSQFIIKMEGDELKIKSQ